MRGESPKDDLFFKRPTVTPKTSTADPFFKNERNDLLSVAEDVREKSQSPLLVTEDLQDKSQSPLVASSRKSSFSSRRSSLRRQECVEVDEGDGTEAAAPTSGVPYQDPSTLLATLSTNQSINNNLHSNTR